MEKLYKQKNNLNQQILLEDAFIAVDFFNSWSVDEICILEISKDESYLKHFIKLVNKLSERCFIPPIGWWKN